MNDSSSYMGKSHIDRTRVKSTKYLYKLSNVLFLALTDLFALLCKKC